MEGSEAGSSHIWSRPIKYHGPIQTFMMEFSSYTICFNLSGTSFHQVGVKDDPRKLLPLNVEVLETGRGICSDPDTQILELREI